MADKCFPSGVLILFFILSCAGSACASLVIQSQESVHIELKGYNGLTEISLFAGKLSAGAQQHINTPYRGLVLLAFEQGQHYPIILGENSFTITIPAPNTPPVFTGSEENVFFYQLLAGTKSESGPYPFARLMIEAKELLESTSSIRTVAQLTEMKARFHGFVRSNYQYLQHSDMLRQLLGNYFMMHEYVDYHVQGAPATDIRLRYEAEIMDGVRNWLDILGPHIPQHEVFNYCVSLYYNRSMVTLASKIIRNFQEVGFCPGVEMKAVNFPPELPLTDGSTNKTTMGALSGSKTVAFVSDDCPVSLVETVIRARHSARYPDTTVVVVPLQQLSGRHLAMRKMVSGGNMLFVDDESWRKKNVPENLKLPRFAQIEE